MPNAEVQARFNTVEHGILEFTFFYSINSSPLCGQFYTKDRGRSWFLSPFTRQHLSAYCIESNCRSAEISKWRQKCIM